MAYLHTTLDDIRPHPLERGHHQKGKIDELFIDSCVQIWPDTDYAQLHEYSPTAYVQTTFLPHANVSEAVDAMANWHRIARAYPNIRLVYSAHDIVQAHKAGQAAIILAAQGGDFLENHLDRLDVFHAMGLRLMLPAYNNKNAICDGCLEPNDGGLSRMGKEWVAACNRLGIVIDLTHVGEKSTFEIMELSEQPVVFTHSNPKALSNRPRNITDDQIRQAAATGGVIAPTNYAPFNLPVGQTTRPTLSQYLDAIDHIVDLTGIDHVGIGTDKSHGTYPDGDLIRGTVSKRLFSNEYATHIEVAPRSRLFHVEGFDDYGQLPQVKEALATRGYDDTDIAKILGGNFLRVFESVWKG